jgi:hypothetical protein
VDTHLADACAVIEDKKCHVFLQCIMHGYPRVVPGERVYCYVIQRRRPSSEGLKMWTCQVTETENCRSCRIPGGWRRVGNPGEMNGLS